MKCFVIFRPGRRSCLGSYVVPEMGSREQPAAVMIERIMVDVAEDWFLPVLEFVKSLKDRWHQVLELLFPGYVFCSICKLEMLPLQPHLIRSSKRFLDGDSEKFIPFAFDKAGWFEWLPSMRWHAIKMSIGLIDEGPVVVADGPPPRGDVVLKIDRHKRLTYLILRMVGRSESIRVGLDLIRKRL